MNRKEKMLAIKRMIEKADGYEAERHLTCKLNGQTIWYYVDTDDYFQIVYEGYKVNVNGTVVFPDLEHIGKFDIDGWLDSILYGSKDTIVVDGKEG